MDTNNDNYLESGLGENNTPLPPPQQQDVLDEAGLTHLWGIIDKKFKHIVTSGVGENTLGKEVTIEDQTVTCQNGEVFNTYDGANIAAGDRSHSEGYDNKAIGNASHVEGLGNTTIGIAAHAEGFNTQAKADDSHVEGFMTIAEGSHSHAEGHKTEALGTSSHVEGAFNTTIGSYSHASGQQTIAIGDHSHTEGVRTYAYDESHAEGYGCVAAKLGVSLYRIIKTEYNDQLVKIYLAETIDLRMKDSKFLFIFHSKNNVDKIKIELLTINAVDNCIIVKPFDSTHISKYDYLMCQIRSTYRTCNHSEGYNTYSLGFANHVEGYYTIADGNHSHAEGAVSLALSDDCHAEGNNTISIGAGSHVEGISCITGLLNKNVFKIEQNNFANKTIKLEKALTEDIAGKTVYLYKGANVIIATVIRTNSDMKTIELHENTIDFSNCTYLFCNISGLPQLCAHAEGKSAKALGYNSHAEGMCSEAIGNNSHASGRYTIAQQSNEMAIGYWNKESAYGPTNLGNLFTVGNGVEKTTRSNIFRVHYNNGCYSTKAFNSTGADYAEFFLWEDENPDNEDRIGRFVTINEDKILLANSEDTYIVGIISGDPSVVGDVHDDQWHDMYLRDIYGRTITEYREEPDIVTEEIVMEPQEVEVEVPDPEDPTKTIKQIEVVEVEKTVTHVTPGVKGNFMVVNPEYNPDETYIPRSERPEWGCVGMMGKIVMIDDGTCKPNGFAWASHDGIATHSDKQTKFRVMKRIDDTHIKVVIVP